MTPPDTVRVSVPWFVIAGGALFSFLLLGLLGAQVLIIEDQRSSIDRQLAINARQSARAIPLIEETRPLIEQARGALPQTERLGKGALELTETLPPVARELGPLVRDLGDSRAAESIRAAGSLAATLLDNDIGSATRATRAIATELVRTDLPLTTQYVRAVSSELLFKHRLRRTLLRSLHVLGQTRRLDTIPKATRATEVVSRYVPEQTRLLRRSVAVQTETLKTNRQVLAMIAETLAVARETEKHAESIDRKTGGTTPTAGP